MGWGGGGQGKVERNVVSIAPPSPYCFIVSIIQPLAENQRWQPFNPFIKIKDGSHNFDQGNTEHTLKNDTCSAGY